MTYTVLWSRTAENELIALWADQADRAAVTAAADAIDRLLQRNPADQGESRSDSTRVMFLAPLGVLFEIQEKDRKVYVLRVWKISQRGGQD